MRIFDDPTEPSAARVAAALNRGQQIRTPVPYYPDREVSAAGPVILQPGDEACSTCGSVIDEFGGAPYILVLATIKRGAGETYCADCHRPEATA